jgi:Flp pilus assembly protein TadG
MTTIRLRSERGQTMVEFAIVLPILATVLLGITQFGLAFHNYLGITDAARVGARAAAVHRTTGACPAARTAIQTTVSTTQWSTISSRITCTAGANVGDPVTISIKYPFSIGLPSFSKSGDLTASATERLE